MRIAIVDDIGSEREALSMRLTLQLNRLALHADISGFESGRDFLSAAKEEPFDLVFLDIYMDGENGVDTAKELRLFDQDCLLVFTTTSTDHALDGFRVRAFQYLVKPYSDRELEVLFDELMARLPEPDQYIEVNVTGGSVRLRFREILYAEHYLHQIHIWTSDGRETVTRQTFREFKARLCDSRFFPCSRGMIINLEYVKDFNGTDFILKDGKRIPVSRDQAKAARLAFGDFLFQRGHTL
ncbi:LytR/AlgR family response regulator transcription factor [Bianquea renquensis]|jgi:DNA-binding response regulator, lytTr family|uniref:Stage 0 sporulation protein A homolog n=1 Tax=Bianquea renquensis TaxID=2763661 RepID=A0A926DRH1_9FIRM|nr:LytTR family DNA-binding domain-containing protein [Bianquea renquensis]MBC8543880.1 response regulator transcription factor [Bianquea renquensis]